MKKQTEVKGFRQGDVYLRELKGFEKYKSYFKTKVKGSVLAEGEGHGHLHKVVEEGKQLKRVHSCMANDLPKEFFEDMGIRIPDTVNPEITMFEVVGETGALIHTQDDTLVRTGDHEDQVLDKGLYISYPQYEYSPSEYQRVLD